MSAFTQPLAQVREAKEALLLVNGRTARAIWNLRHDAALARVERLAAEMETTLENLKREIDLYPTLYEGLTPIIAALPSREEGDGAR